MDSDHYDNYPDTGGYDIVKRFFCETLRSLGYAVYIDPLFTGDWSGQETTFYRFLGVEPYVGTKPAFGSTALFLDPDTGVRVNILDPMGGVTFDQFDDPAEFLDGLGEPRDEYLTQYWIIGEQVSKEQHEKFLGPETKELYR